MMSEEMEREETERDMLIATILSATTPEQCDHAEDLVVTWMKTHPRDFGILDAGGHLAMMSDRFNRPAGEARKVSAA